MIAFLTQYYRGLGHSNRIKLIAEETAKYSDVLIIDQLFKPPLKYSVKHVAILDNVEIPKGRDLSGFILNENITNFRIKKFKETIDNYPIKTIVIEGFPFCRHQFAYEYFKYLDICKANNIKIIFSVRDFPWDDPHEDQLKDWVNFTQNLICKCYAEKVLIHGDEQILPLYSDRTKLGNSYEVIKNIKDLLIYTGYVCDDSQKAHKRKNNLIYVSTGLNKEEGLLIFKEITKIAPRFPNYKFVMPIANQYLKTGNTTRDNLIFVEFIPELNKKIQDCAAYITYGGYNATMEILKSQVPAIVIPRQDGQKLEQFVRAYVFEPYEYFKVLNTQEFNKLEATLKNVLTTTPKKFQFDLDGTRKSASEILKIHKS
jgi:predicted glycosyltransferase